MTCLGHSLFDWVGAPCIKLADLDPGRGIGTLQHSYEMRPIHEHAQAAQREVGGPARGHTGLLLGL